MPAPEAHGRRDRRRAITRRTLLAGAAAGTIGGAGIAASRRAGFDPVGARAAVDASGPHQPGIATPQQRHLALAAFDVTATSLGDLHGLLSDWTAAATSLMQGSPVATDVSGQPPGDPGDAVGLDSKSLTLTLGFGPTLFRRDGEDRFGLAQRMPPELTPLPAFRGDSLEPHISDGDLCVQACADDPQVAFHAVHALARLGADAATLRWLQTGFLPNAGRETPRNLLGFKDGTRNIALNDATALAKHVWVNPTDNPAWMRNGSYLVARRVRLLLDVWDATSREQQERVIGRQKGSGAPLGSTGEADKAILDALSAGSTPLIPSNAHIRLAASESNGGVRILRRSYSFVESGADGNELGAGLMFVCFQRDPRRQFAVIQRRLAENDALSKHILHVGSAVFACPASARPWGYLGSELLGL